MKTIELKKAPPAVFTLAKGTKRESFVFTADGRPVAALISVRKIDREALSLSLNPDFIGLIQRSRASLERTGGMSLREVRQHLRVAKSSTRMAARRTA